MKNNKIITECFISIGLSEVDADIYLSILNNPGITIQEITKKLNDWMLRSIG